MRMLDRSGIHCRNIVYLDGVTTCPPQPHGKGHLFGVLTRSPDGREVHHRVFVGAAGRFPVMSMAVGDCVHIEGPLSKDKIVIALQFTNLTHMMRKGRSDCRSLGRMIAHRNHAVLRGVVAEPCKLVQGSYRLVVRTFESKSARTYVADHDVQLSADRQIEAQSARVGDCVECDGAFIDAVLFAERFTNLTAAVRLLA